MSDAALALTIEIVPYPSLNIYAFTGNLAPLEYEQICS